MKSVPRIAAVVMAIAIGTGASVASAAEGAFYGLLRARDLTPFGFLRLDMRPAHAVAIEPRTWALETELGYQNTWALSPEVEEYLTNLEPQGRHDLGTADVEAIGNLPGVTRRPVTRTTRRPEMRTRSIADAAMSETLSSLAAVPSARLIPIDARDEDSFGTMPNSNCLDKSSAQGRIFPIELSATFAYNTPTKSL